jgi:hypothetical protein
LTTVPLARTTSKLTTLLAAQPYWELRKLKPPGHVSLRSKLSFGVSYLRACILPRRHLLDDLRR